MYAILIPSFVLLLIVGFIGALHPYVSGVFTTLASGLHGHGLAKRRIIFSLCCYILAQFAIFALVCLLLLLFAAILPVQVMQIIELLLGIYLVLWAIIEVRAWRDPHRMKSKLPPQALRWARKAIEQQPTVQNGIYVALLIGVAQMQLLLAPLLAYFCLTHQGFSSSGMLSVLLLSAVIVLPMIKILFLLSGKTRVSTVKDWQRRLATPIRLISAACLLLLGVLLLLTAGRILYIG